jgi:integrase/recombinase XerD
MAPAPRRSADRAALRDREALGTATTKRAAVLTADQIAQMLGAGTTRDRALLALMTVGAMRVGEATLLTWGDVSPEGVVTIPGGTTKTRVGRSFTLPAAAADYLAAWRQECPATAAGWIFPGTPISQPLSIRGAQTIVSRLAGRCGLQGVSSHSLRRSTLTAAHAAGLSLREVAEISGHQSLAALERYLDQGAARDKAEAARGLLL